MTPSVLMGQIVAVCDRCDKRVGVTVRLGDRWPGTYVCIPCRNKERQEVPGCQ